jgi:lysine 6-dehydrogenase
MQGTAAAYDLARFASARQIVLADISLDRASQAADRVNRLVGLNACEPAQVDVMDPRILARFLAPVDVLLSCVPYWMHPQIAEIAIDCGTGMCDLGGNTEITWDTLSLNERAQVAGVSIVPDCGLAPGLVNSLGLYLMEQMDACTSVKLYCGVLPRHPKPPFNYKLTFNIEGLVTEYDYKAIALRGGEIVEVDTLSELESLNFPELGEMEAFTTSGGTSTAPYTLQEVLQDYEYKTIRFPGHCERMRIFKDFGFWGEEPLEIKGATVKPKDLFCRIFGERLSQIQDTDQCLIRGVATGVVNSQPIQLQADLHDFQDEETGFSSMERLTGFSLSIYAQAVAAGSVPIGCIRYEQAMTGAAFFTHLALRGIRCHLTHT